MMLSRISILLTLCLPVVLSAQTSWKYSSASIDFFIYNAGLEVDGTIEGFDATLQFLPDDLSNSYVRAELKPETIETGISARDRHLREEDYFHVDRYPLITMKSVSFSRSGDRFSGTFDLTIKGETRRVTFPFSFSTSGNEAKFRGEFQINRLDFGVGESSWFLSDEVRIQIKVSAKAVES